MGHSADGTKQGALGVGHLGLGVVDGDGSSV